MCTTQYDKHQTLPGFEASSSDLDSEPVKQFQITPLFRPPGGNLKLVSSYPL